MGQKSLSTTKFGMVLGIYFAFKILIGVNPIMAGIFTLIGGAIIGMFWPFLSFKQNILMGVIRFMMNSFRITKETTKITLVFNRFIEYVLHFLNSYYEQLFELASRDFQYSLLDIERSKPYLIYNLARANSHIIVLLLFTGMAILAYFIEPYLIYRLAKWRGVYNQIPFGEMF